MFSNIKRHGLDWVVCRMAPTVASFRLKILVQGLIYIIEALRIRMGLWGISYYNYNKVQSFNIEALRIRMGLWGISYYNYNKVQSFNIEALRIRMGFWGISYYYYNKEPPQNSIGND